MGDAGGREEQRRANGLLESAILRALWCEVESGGWYLAFVAEYTCGMHHLISAIFDAGVFRPLEPVDLPDGTQVEVQVPQGGDKRSQVPQAAATPWHDFFDQTYGSCANLGLERSDQGDLEPREPVA
jgi:Protein of unknown function DUF104